MLIKIATTAPRSWPSSHFDHNDIMDVAAAAAPQQFGTGRQSSLHLSKHLVPPAPDAATPVPSPRVVVATSPSRRCPCTRRWHYWRVWRHVGASARFSRHTVDRGAHQLREARPRRWLSLGRSSMLFGNSG
jgi:hypothetical protein